MLAAMNTDPIFAKEMMSDEANRGYLLYDKKDNRYYGTKKFFMEYHTTSNGRLLAHEVRVWFQKCYREQMTVNGFMLVKVKNPMEKVAHQLTLGFSSSERDPKRRKKMKKSKVDMMAIMAMQDALTHQAMELLETKSNPSKPPKP